MGLSGKIVESVWLIMVRWTKMDFVPRFYDSALRSPGHGLFLKRCLLASERSIFKKYFLFAVVLRAFMLRRPRPPTQHHPHTDLPNHMAEAPLTSTEMLKSPASPKTGNHCTRAKSKILKKGVVVLTMRTLIRGKECIGTAMCD